MVDKVSPKGREREKGKKSVRSTRRLLCHVVTPIGDGAEGNMWTEVYIEVKHGFTDGQVPGVREASEAREVCALPQNREQLSLEALVQTLALAGEESEAETCGLLVSSEPNDG